MDNAPPQLLWWFLGILAAIISAVVSGGVVAWLTALYSRVHSHGEDIAVLKSEMLSVQGTLKGIDAKLDKLLERQ